MAWRGAPRRSETVACRHPSHRQLPPVAQRAAQRRMVGARAIEADAVINLAERGVDGVDVAAMAVQPIEPLEAVARKALRPILHRRDHGGGPQRDGAGERHVVLRLADIEGGRDQNAGLVARALADDLRAQRIGAEQAVRPMLLRRADGNSNTISRSAATKKKKKKKKKIRCGQVFYLDLGLWHL